MLARDWIKQAQRKGWLVSGIVGLSIKLVCSRQGCAGSVSVPFDNPGPPPDPCNRDHIGQYSAHAFTEYDQLIDEFRRRRLALGLSQEDVNDAAGFADGYINKLEARHRYPQFPTLSIWAQALGIEITTAPAKIPPKTLKTIQDRTHTPYQRAQARFKRKTSKGA